MKAALLALAAGLAAAPAARAGEAACWYENGVVVVGAQVMGVAGDFILDTGTPTTQLAETQAQGAGFEETALTGEVRLAGLSLADRPVTVADIDVRTGLLPTPIAGIIGADVLKGEVLDVSFAPCRVGLWPAGKAPRLRGAKAMALSWVAERPTVGAAVTDGAASQPVTLSVATGADAAVRLSDALAGAEGASKPAELYPYGVLRPKLKGLALAGATFEDTPGGLLKAETGVDGEVGPPVLERFRLRFDFPAGKLWVAANEKGPGATSTPYRGWNSRKEPGREATRRGPDRKR